MGPDWEFEILDADPPVDALVSLGVGDLDGDGRDEIVTGGEDGIFWYRPGTGNRGVVDGEAQTMVGLELLDLDGDGRDEVVASVHDDDADTWTLSWFDPGASLDGRWDRHVVDPDCPGSPHDICYADIDDDGEPELVSNATFTETPGVFAYDRPGDPNDPWERYALSTGRFAEGLAVGDVDGDGRPEVVNGPDLFHRPDSDVSAKEWSVETIAPSMRSFCRTALVDVTGDGRLDVVLSESEYPDSRLMWYENRTDGWEAHELERGLYDAHTLSAWRENGVVSLYVAEMAEGGWGGHYRWDAEQLLFTSDDAGTSWSREVVARGAGTHEGVAVDVDGDGRREFVGKEANHPVVHLLRRGSGARVEFAHRLLDRDKPYASTDVLAADVNGDGRTDVVTGRWWYRSPDWERFEIPGVTQVHAAGDLDADGSVELIGSTAGRGTRPELTSDLVWLDPVDPVAGEWRRHRIGDGSGAWVQGSVLAPVGKGDDLAFVATYYAEDRNRVTPDVFEIPPDPTDPWDRHSLADVSSGRDVLAADVTGGGLDLLIGGFLVEKSGDEYVAHRVLPENFSPARLAFGDVTGGDRPTFVAGEASGEFAGESLPHSRRAGFDAEDSRLRGPRPSLDEPPLGRLAWFDPGDEPREEWSTTVVDRIRHPRSVGVGDLDDDGVDEIVAGEHDPSWRYRSSSRLFVYESADADGGAWTRHLVEDRFEHNAGGEVVRLDGRPSVLSHGWSDTKYVHLFSPVADGGTSR